MEDKITKDKEMSGLNGSGSDKSGYTDIHTHVIPGVDDGSDSTEESLKMLREAYKQGIRRIIATPHCLPGTEGQEDVKAAFGKLTEAVKEEGLPEMDLYLGNELYYNGDTVNDLKMGRALTLCETRYVLVEFSVRGSYQGLYKGLRELVEAGYRPVLAHAERYDCLFKNEDRINEIIRLGAYIQINADSFLGGRFESTTSWCMKLFKDDKVHFLASDCHDSDYRVPVMETAVSKLTKKFGKEMILQVTENNIDKLFKNEYI